MNYWDHSFVAWVSAPLLNTYMRKDRLKIYECTERVGPDLIYNIPSMGPTSSQTRELLPPCLSSPPVFLLGLVKPGIEPTTLPLGDAPPTDISDFVARPYPGVKVMNFDLTWKKAEMRTQICFYLMSQSRHSWVIPPESQPSESRAAEGANIPVFWEKAWYVIILLLSAS